MYEIYTILSDDTLDNIARIYDTSVEVLTKINGIDSDYVLMSGNQLIVPVKRKRPYQYYTVKKGDNMYDIANDNGIDYNLLLKLNGLEADDYIYPNQTITLPRNGLSIYLIKENDTINDVLKKLNISLDELLKENDKIYLRPEQIVVFKEK